MAGAVEEQAMMQEGDMGEEEQVMFNPIDRLEGPGLGAPDIKKLRDAGYHTIEAVAYATRKELGAIKGISDNKVDKIVESAFKMLGSMGFTTKVAQSRQDLCYLSTGSAARWPPQARRGQLHHGDLGEFRTRKAPAAVRDVPTADGAGRRRGQGHVHRHRGHLRRSASSRSLTARPQRAGRPRRRRTRAYSSDHQSRLLVEAACMMADSRHGLLIVDSATGLCRTDYQARRLSARQMHLKFMRALAKLSQTYGVACVIANQVVAKVDGAASFAGPAVAPIGSNIIAHASTTRLSLRKGRGETRICRFDSPCSPRASDLAIRARASAARPSEDGAGRDWRLDC